MNTVKGVRKTGRKVLMGDISVELDSCYYANGVSVHNSSRQKTYALSSIGLDTGQRTKAGDMVFNKDLLKSLEHPVFKQLTRYASINTLLSSFTKKLERCPEQGRANYKPFHVPTARLASGSDSKKYLPLNIQNIPKPKEAIYEVTEEKTPFYIHGYYFRQLEKDEKRQENKKYVEGFDQFQNIRNCFVAPPGYIIVSIDYEQEELQLIADISKERVLLKAFKEEKDPYMELALNMFPGEPPSKAIRKKGKAGCLALNYKGTPKTLQVKHGLSVEESHEVYNAYWKALRTLERWQRTEISKSYRSGVCYNQFGRPRRVKQFLASHLPNIRAFGERTVINNKIQATGGDIIRIGTVNASKKYVKVTNGDVLFMATVHDELDFYIREEKLMDYLPDICRKLEITVPGTQLPLRTGVELGYKWGSLLPFKFNKDKTKLTPKYI